MAVWAEPTRRPRGGRRRAAGRVAVVPINPKPGARARPHLVSDSQPRLLLHRPGSGSACRALARPAHAVDIACRARRRSRRPSRRSARRSSSTPRAPPARPRARCCRAGRSPPTSTRSPTPGSGPAADVVAHALPLFHVHGLVLGMLGPLRRGGAAHPPRPLLRPRPSAAALRGRGDDAVRRADDVPPARRRGRAGRRAGARRWARRGCSSPARPRCRPASTSASSASPASGVVERYGMTETLMNTAVRADGDARARATSGRRWPASSCGCVDDDGEPIDAADDETIGEIEVRGPNLFLRLPQPARRDRRGACATGGFATGDLATRDADGTMRHRRPPRHRPDQERRLQDRRRRDRGRAARASGGGRGRRHRRARRRPRRAGRRLGGRCARARRRARAELLDHVAELLAPHKRPREVRFLDELPRNAMGKVQKRELRQAEAAPRPDPPG